MLGQLSTDVRYAMRIARRRKWVSAAIVVSVAFGIGGATAIFAVIDRVLLRPLPVPSPEQVVWIRTTDSKLARVAKGMTPGDAYDVRTRATSFARMALGEDAGSLVRRVITGAGRMSLAGAVLGALGAFGVARALEGFLVGTQVWNLGLLVGLVALLAVVTVGAAYVPARRASRVDPVIALRSD